MSSDKKERNIGEVMGRLQLDQGQGETMKIEKNGENETWAVHSDSGNVYEVRFLGMDGELRRWACSCPAGEHGRKCKHAVAVADQTASTAGEEGMDAGGGDIFGCRPNSSSGRPMADRYGC